MRCDPARRSRVEAGVAAFAAGRERSPQVASRRKAGHELAPAERAQLSAFPRLRIGRAAVVWTQGLSLEHAQALAGEGSRSGKPAAQAKVGMSDLARPRSRCKARAMKPALRSALPGPAEAAALFDLPRPPRESRVVVAMSGGVDSSVVAALAAASGAEVIGVTLQLYDYGAATGRKGACCAGDDIRDARGVADRLGFAHYVFDHESAFRDEVVERFA